MLCGEVSRMTDWSGQYSQVNSASNQIRIAEIGLLDSLVDFAVSLKSEVKSASSLTIVLIWNSYRNMNSKMGYRSCGALDLP